MTTVALTADYTFLLLAIISAHRVMLSFGWPTPGASCCAASTVPQEILSLCWSFFRFPVQT